MDTLDVKFTLDDVKYDVTKNYDRICILIGQRLINTGNKDDELVAIAGKLSVACKMMREYSDERDC